MLKPFLQNKRSPDGSVTQSVNISGVDVDREHLERMRRKLLEELAREKDPVKETDLALRLAQVKTTLAAFDAIDQARADAAPLRESIRQKELAVANQQRETYAGYINELVRPALERFGMKNAHGDTNHLMRMMTVQAKYFDQLFASLTFTNAERQVKELREAEAEGREWRDLVKLPRPLYGDPDEDTTIRIIAKKIQEIVHY